jgi:hypothetical protein
MKTIRVVLMLVMIAVASTSYAGLLVDLRPVAGTGYQILPDGKTVVFAAAGEYEVNYRVVAVVTGTNGNFTDDGLTMVSGGIRTEALGTSTNTNAFTTFLTGMSGGPTNYVAPFTGGVQAITVTPTLIGNQSGTTTVGAFYARNPTAGGSLNVDASTQWPLAAFTSHVSVKDGHVDGTQFASVNYLKNGAALGTFTWKMDNLAKNGSAGAANYDLITVGQPVNLMTDVPEPGTLVLLGAGVFGVGLMLWRRKRA